MGSPIPKRNSTRMGAVNVKPILTDTVNLVLKGPEGSDVMDLPVTLIAYGDGQKGVESCWKLGAEELEEVKRTGVIYFVCMAHTHPPICLSPYSSLTGKAGGQYDTGVNPLTVCGKNPTQYCTLCAEESCPASGWKIGGTP